MMIDNNLNVDCYDPLVSFSNCKDLKLLNELPDSSNYSVIVLAVKHTIFKNLNFYTWLKNYTGTLIDSNYILCRKELKNLANLGFKVQAIGRGTL